MEVNISSVRSAGAHSESGSAVVRTAALGTPSWRNGSSRWSPRAGGDLVAFLRTVAPSPIRK